MGALASHARNEQWRTWVCHRRCGEGFWGWLRLRNSHTEANTRLPTISHLSLSLRYFSVQRALHSSKGLRLAVQAQFDNFSRRQIPEPSEGLAWPHDSRRRLPSLREKAVILITWFYRP